MSAQPDYARLQLRAIRRRREYPLPTRWPTAAHRVRWVHPSWKRNRSGKPAWSERWFVSITAATRFARRRTEAGHVVAIDSFYLKYVGTTDVNSELGVEP